MIQFESVRYKNFLSTGNQFTEIEFNKSQTTLIVGNNGAGKSTVLDALTFSLFGKSFRGVNKPQLINSINEKDCVVEVSFSIGKINWKVVRGIKPSIFEIYRNGKLLNQDSAAIDQQKWFEQNVLKMNFKSFSQIVILGSSNFVPFMQLSAANRRDIIEDLLDIKIFSSMNSVLKDRIRSIKDEMKTFDLKKQTLEEKVAMQNNFILDIENLGKTDIENKKNSINDLNIDIKNYINENEVLQNKLTQLKDDLENYSDVKGKLKKLDQLKGKITQKITTISTEHKFFEQNTVCPTCTQTIEEEFRLNRIVDAKSKAKELQSGYIELEEAIKNEEDRERQFSALSQETISLTHGISQNNTKISGCQRQIRNLESEIQRITENLANRNTEHEKLTQFRDQLDQTTEEIKTKKDELLYYDYVYGLLKDGGVKTKIIKKYIPLINQQVNKYLQMMDFYINFTLDEEFNESIKSPIHDQFSYGSFSEGEKMRIDLALLFTWREIAKIKNSLNCNLIIFDETFDSSLDGFGTDDFLKIIRFIIKDANIFVISHKDGLKDKFVDVLKFEKVKGFSRLAT
jgi:DNA repair exonuclease SbcCD ATPase subunit